jgi:hypothetical protein
MSIHRDSEIYENPHDFIPERFMDSPTGNSKLDNQKSAIFYSPFGDGPRHCIGEYSCDYHILQYFLKLSQVNTNNKISFFQE